MMNPQLPEELIVEILLKLPVRSLLQFKCVSKSWETLISDPQFEKNHLLTSTAYPQLPSAAIGVHCSYEILSYPIKPLLENPSTPITPVDLSTGHLYDILGSCNGLLCMFDNVKYNFTLWNPSFNFKSKTSPTIVSSEEEVMIYNGFGYDQVNDKYKVVVAMQDEFQETISITRIYTFGDNSWTTVTNSPPGDAQGQPGRYVSGTLNWIGTKDNKETIVSIDLEKEIYGEVLLPHVDNIRSTQLNVLRNCLCAGFDHVKETHWTVWMMKEYGVVESWTKLMIIPQEEFKFIWNPLFMS